ncbi:MAG: maleylpyruvate isomerase N-terminal domain-containing protein [Beutenbergiaceae bacterium]
MVTLDALLNDYRQQWQVLSDWMSNLPDPAAPTPSVLPGWSLADLIGHLGRVHDSVLALRPVELPPDDEPVTLSEYLASYAGGGAHITEVTQAFTAQIADDPLGQVRLLGERAIAHLQSLADRGPESVVQARRGPITLLDFVRSRLIELVVHGYDLAPTLPVPAPVDPTARTIVANALIEVVRHRTGYRIEVVNEEPWIKAATGRISWADAVAARTIKPESVSDGTPDLSRALPLL